MSYVRTDTQTATSPIGKLLGLILAGSDRAARQRLAQALLDQQEANEFLAGGLSRTGVLDSADSTAALAAPSGAVTLEDALKAAAGVRRLLGSLLVGRGRLTPGQLDLALEEQKLTGEKLGEILIRRGLLSPEELETCLACQHEQRLEAPTPVALKLGEILVAAGYITRTQLTAALEQQKHSTKRIGEILVEGGFAQPYQVEHGVRLQRMLVTAALATVLTFSATDRAAAASSGGSSSSTLHVTATIRPVATMKILHQLPQLTVTAQDVAKGYVDVPVATLLEVKNNSPAGYLLSFENQGPFRDVLVRGLGTEVQISFGNGWVLMPYSRVPVRMELSYRFVLAENAEVGTYPWPLQINSLPL
jgi:hypothetical protein